LILAIVRREVHGYFVSPIAYTVITGFLLISGYGFLKAIERYTSINPLQFAMEQITIQSGLIWRLNSWANLATLLCLPALSMRLFSEERKGGTIELLLTSPMTTPQLVLGKYLGAMVVYTMIVAMTAPYMIVLGWIGNPDWPAVATTYLGYVLFGGVLLAVGQFASAITENQIVALVLTYALFLPFFLIGEIATFFGSGVGDVLAGLSVRLSKYQFTQGLVDTHDLILNGSLIFLFLFLSTQVLDSSRWR
jgi:ABC-2 type transport system permease protein